MMCKIIIPVKVNVFFYFCMQISVACWISFRGKATNDDSHYANQWYYLPFCIILYHVV